MTTAKRKSKTKPLAEFGPCRKCGLHRFRRKIVLGEGVMPADVLIVGEAPGKSEDLLGRPFVGPSGKILREALRRAQERAKADVNYYITNTVSCRPTDRKRGENRAPTDAEQMACWPRLRKTERLVKPKYIVLLGREAERACKPHWPEAVTMQHPAYILRRGGKSSTEYRQIVRALTDVFREVRDVRAR